MYDELIKRLRNCATEAAPCKTCDMAGDGSCADTLMRQAADAIEELSKKLYFQDITTAQILETYIPFFIPKWIPVTERLPETRTRCVTISKDGDYGLGLYTTDYGWMFPYYTGETTHWMPLPEPPKEET